MARALIDENTGTEWLPDSAENPDGFDLDLMVNESMDEYARQTLGYTAEYSITATPDKAVYLFSDFGTQADPDAGGRIFRPVAMGYNKQLLDELDRSQLAGMDRNWRWATSGTPFCWWQQGRAVRVLSAPAGEGELYLEGYETPDNTLWADDSDEPPCHVLDHKLIAMGSIWAVVTIMNPSKESRFRASALGQALASGYAQAKTNLKSTRAQIAVGSGESGYTGPVPISQRVVRLS